MYLMTEAVSTFETSVYIYQTDHNNHVDGVSCDHQRVCCSSPRQYMSMKNHGGMTETGENSRFSGNLTTSHLVANKEELGKGNYEFGLRNIFCSYFEVIYYVL
jgi:hypothetical protein